MVANAMTISANYPSPVTVNGFSCRNCTEVDYAKKNIDPANPKAGPFGVNDPDGSRSADPATKRKALAAERLELASYQASAMMTPSNALGTMVDIRG